MGEGGVNVGMGWAATTTRIRGCVGLQGLKGHYRMVRLHRESVSHRVATQGRASDHIC